MLKRGQGLLGRESEQLSSIRSEHLRHDGLFIRLYMDSRPKQRLVVNRTFS